MDDFKDLSNFVNAFIVKCIRVIFLLLSLGLIGCGPSVSFDVNSSAIAGPCYVLPCQGSMEETVDSCTCYCDGVDGQENEVVTALPLNDIRIGDWEDLYYRVCKTTNPE